MISSDPWEEKAEEPEPFGTAVNGPPLCYLHLVIPEEQIGRGIPPRTSARSRPARLEGQSSGFLRTQGSEACWPQVVVMRNGTGAFAQRNIR